MSDRSKNDNGHFGRIYRLIGSKPFLSATLATVSLFLVASLAFGSCGYVAMKECYGRGGYETTANFVGGGAGEDTSDRFIEKSIALLKGEV